jgi:galactose mutarotase-like enzyme
MRRPSRVFWKRLLKPKSKEVETMSFRPQYILTLAAAVLFSVAGCKQSAPPSPAPAAQPVAATPTQIGGEDIVKLTRAATSNGQKPEFLSATILPGRGMNVFQITANLPGKGTIDVLASPSLAEAAEKLNGGPDDQYGNASFSFGGAFLVPYPNRIRGKLSADSKTLTIEWHGKTITLPANWPGKKPGAEPVAMHGMILDSKTDDVNVQTIPDGQVLTGTIHAGDFGGHWLSKTDLSFKLTLTGDAFDAEITAKNVDDEAEPIAIGWHPYLSIPSGDRAQARVHVPATQTAQVNNYDDVFPTGKLLPVKGTKYDFNAPDGTALDDSFYDDNWSNLKRTEGVVDVRLTDPADNYGIHVDGVSPEIKTVQVYSPPTQKFAAIEEQFNFADPFGKEWHGMNTGMVTLKPGQSVTWHVRLALFTPSK